MTLSQVVTAYCGYFEQEERRSQIQWEQVRMLGFWVHNSGMNKRVSNPEQMIKFPWDTKKNVKPINPDVEFPDKLKDGSF